MFCAGCGYPLVQLGSPDSRCNDGSTDITAAHDQAGDASTHRGPADDSSGGEANPALITHRCPECGHRFDPSDPRSFLAVRLNACGLALKAWLALALAIGFYATRLMTPDNLSGNVNVDEFIELAWVGAGFGSTMWLFSVSSRARAGLRGPPDDRPWCRLALVPLLLLALCIATALVSWLALAAPPNPPPGPPPPPPPATLPSGQP